MSKSLKVKPKKSLLTNGKLIPLDEGASKRSFPKVSKLVPAGTFYKVERRNGATHIALMTVMPDGTKIAWDNCGRCHNHARLCKCASGVVTCRSVEYIFDKTNAIMAGESWDHNHRNYKGTILRTRDEGKKNRVPSMPTLGTQRSTKKKPWEEIDIPAPKSKGRTGAESKPLAPMAKEATDAGKMLKTTNRLADDLEKQFTKKLSKPTTKKTLKKRSKS